MPKKIPFRVIHVSGQDENYKALELNHHSPTTKGWQSSRFCVYPQDIVVQLENRVKLRKIQLLSHQYLIATKIEFYVGDVPEGTNASLQNARYTRLGYVALSSNEKTGFKARELKSVHVDAQGLFVKFVIHKNYVNKYNIYNQVGIIAVNVIGEDLHPENSQYPYVLEDNEAADPEMAKLFNKPDYISPLDDLAFDMYQDPETAQVIRQLEKKKQEAVLQEKYEFAKKIKNAIQELQKVGEKLGKLEVEKRQAVENEDYDKAKLKKLQMDEYRLQMYNQLQLDDLLHLHSHRGPPAPAELTYDSSPRRPTELPPSPVLNGGGASVTHRSVATPPRTAYEDRPLPAIRNRLLEQGDGAKKVEDNIDDKPTAVFKTAVYEDDEEPIDDSLGNVTGEAEPLNEKDQREAAVVIDTFGQALANKSYSKNFSFREDALLEVYKVLNGLPQSTSKDELRNQLRAATFLIVKGIKDNVFAVFTAALNLSRLILTDFIPKHKVGKPDTIYVLERIIQPLIQKTGDTAARNRDHAKSFIVEASKFLEVKPLNIVPHECVKPFKVNCPPRLALSRTELVEILYKQHGLNDLKPEGLTVNAMMSFCTAGLNHHSGDVREKCEKIIVLLYREVGQPVKDALPPDDEKTRKNVLYKQMFEAFDKIDGKPSKDDLKKQRVDEEVTKKKEIEALQQQLKELKAMTAGKAPVNEKVLQQAEKKAKAEPKKESKKPVLKKSKPTDGKTDDDTLFNIDQTCIFCGEQSDQFTEEGLDLHYWKHCPMLKRCTNCKQVVEIAGLTDHLLQECEAKGNFQKCPRCSEAIPKAEFSQHQTEKLDNPSEAGKNHCPVCHQNFSGGEAGWKDHLMGKDGCKQNPRRMQAISRQAAAAKNKPAGRGAAAKGTRK